MYLKIIPTLSLICLSVAIPCHAQHAQHQGQQKQAHPTPFERDYSLYPIDNRKPCHICSRPDDWKAIPLVDLPGLRGRPHIDSAMGGCSCGKRCPGNHPTASWNWSLPFSAIREAKHPNFSAWLDDPCRPRLTNGYDRLGDFRLINYQRSDNGHCGPGRDPYGCLGESKQRQSRVRGVQFRQPGEPVFGSPSTSSNYPYPAAVAQRPIAQRPAMGSGYNLDAYRKPTRR